MRREPGIVDGRHLRVPDEEGRDGPGVLAVRAHPDRERLQSAERQVAVHRSRHRPDGVRQEREPFDPLGVARDDRAADEVGVAADVLGHAVHDRIGAQLQRSLEHRRRERVVDDDARAGSVRDPGDRG
jgi:hypothetical protein